MIITPYYKMSSAKSAPVSQDLKNLKIKTGSCKRLLADLRVYTKEEEQQNDKIAKMKAANADPYDLKQQENVLAETMAMIPDTKNRLNTAYGELLSAIDMCAGDESIKLTQDWSDAQGMKKTLEEMFD
jgi:tubulin-specific chaperone A